MVKTVSCMYQKFWARVGLRKEKREEALTFAGIHSIPYRAQRHEPEEDDNGVVHARCRNGQNRRHGEQDGLERDPQQRDHVYRPPDRLAQRPLGQVHIPAPVEQRDGDRDAVRDGEGDDTD